MNITYTELTSMLKNSFTYNNMNNEEKSDFLIEFINRYNGRINEIYS